MRLVVVNSTEAGPLMNYSQYLVRLLQDELSVRGFSFRTVDSLTAFRSDPGAGQDQAYLVSIPLHPGMGLRWWTDVQLPLFVKKVQADQVIFLQGYLSKILNCPQILVLPDLSTLISRKHKFSKGGPYSGLRIRNSIKKATKILTYSNHAKTFLSGEFGAKEDKVEVLPFCLSPVQAPVCSPEEKSAIKEKYTGGKEFFILFFDGNLEDTLPVLKAFSVFKKWQKSNMQLVIITEGASDGAAFQEKLGSYKYREDVTLLKIPSRSLYQPIMGSAYAAICLYKKEEHLPHILEAMAGNVPLMITQIGSIAEICGEAAIYIEDLRPEPFGKQLIEIFKDEKLRNRQIQKGSELIKNQNYLQSGKRLWEMLATPMPGETDFA